MSSSYTVTPSTTSTTPKCINDGKIICLIELDKENIFRHESSSLTALSLKNYVKTNLPIIGSFRLFYRYKSGK